jgi:hypothetical protein
MVVIASSSNNLTTHLMYSCVPYKCFILETSSIFSRCIPYQQCMQIRKVVHFKQ